MAHAIGSAREFVCDSWIHINIVVMGIALVKRHQTEALHLLWSYYNGQELVVGDMLHLGNDDASSFLEKRFIAG